MTLVSGEPSTIEELAEEEAESWDHLLGPSTRDAMKRLLADLYATHPVMKRLAAIVTDQGGRTAHAAIVSRELGLPCIVGAGDASRVLRDGEEVTVCCAEGSEGHVYAGLVPFERQEMAVVTEGPTRTQVLLNVADPAQAFRLSAIPNAGVGLARIEFVITNSIGVHPMALVRYPALRDAAAAAKIESLLEGEDPREYFISRLSEGVAGLPRRSIRSR